MKNVIAIVVIVVFGVFVWVALGRGVRVEVDNVGAGEITDLVVEVSGSTHSLDDLASGASDVVKVDPKGTTKRVELTWRYEGRECYGRVDVTFEENGYNGLVRFAIDGITVKEATSEIDAGFF